MKLLDLFESVKERNLTEAQLEGYSDELTNLYASMMVRMADLKKARAMYFYEKNEKHPELPDVKIKRLYEATDDGQELIKLEHYTKATSKVLSSIKSRMYHFI